MQDHMEYADPANEMEPPHLATENMTALTVTVTRQQHPKGPALKRIRRGAAPHRRSLEEKSNVDATSGISAATPSTEGTNNNHNHHHHHTTNVETSRSATVTTNGDVSVRRELLDEFGKQNKQHYEKAAHIGRHPDGVVLTKPVRPKCQAAPQPTHTHHHHRPVIAAASATSATSITSTATKVARKVPSSENLHPSHHSAATHHSSAHHHHAAYRGPELTPVRIKPRFKKEDVEATNNGYASVAKLAAWLADNPTVNKKVTCVRKGANVIAKSRKFERDLENVIIEETGIEVGGVADKKQWLKAAFSEDASDVGVPPVNVSDKRKWLAHAFKRGDGDDDEEEDRETIIETASEILSVTDKKKWLESAFKKGPDGKMKAAVKATSMVNMPRNDDATLRAKKRWQENSARRLAAKEAHHQGDRKSIGDRLSMGDSSVIAEQQQQRVTTTRTPHEGEFASESKAEHQQRERQHEKMAQDAMHEQDSHANAHAMAWELENEATVGEGGHQQDYPGVSARSNVEEDKASVDFRAARELLIQRSKQNGNPLSVVSKVQRRKQKFERIEKEFRKRSGQFGLLRPSWEPAAVEASEGPTIGNYKKTYVEDIVPKKSFEELP